MKEVKVEREKQRSRGHGNEQATERNREETIIGICQSERKQANERKIAFGSELKSRISA